MCSVRLNSSYIHTELQYLCGTADVKANKWHIIPLHTWNYLSLGKPNSCGCDSACVLVVLLEDEKEFPFHVVLVWDFGFFFQRTKGNVI